MSTSMPCARSSSEVVGPIDATTTCRPAPCARESAAAHPLRDLQQVHDLGGRW